MGVTDGDGSRDVSDDGRLGEFFFPPEKITWSLAGWGMWAERTVTVADSHEGLQVGEVHASSG